MYIGRHAHRDILFEQRKWNKEILPKLNFFFDYIKENIIKDLTTAHFQCHLDCFQTNNFAIDSQ